MNATLSQDDLGDSVQDLARRSNCTEFDRELWEMVFTHASYRNEFHPEDQAAERLVGIIQNVGKATLRTAIYELCLDQKGMDSAETSRYSQSKDLFLSSLHEEFHLSSICRFSTGQLKTGSNPALQIEFAEKFLGIIVVSSSYANTRQFICERLNLSASPYPRYADGDAKSWLLEYSQHFYGEKRPEYELVSAIGPEHRKLFHCRVILPDKRRAEGTGLSRKSAEQTAAAKIIDDLHLVSQLPASPSKRAVRVPPCLNVPTGRVDRFLLASTPRIAQRLHYVGIDKNHLAVALTLPASQRGNVETNARHKLLGDALENLAFLLFAFQALPTRALGSSNSAHFVAAICSNAQHARLFDYLDLAAIVSHEPTVQLWEQGKADVIKAIAAAAYLTTRDFDQFFTWLKLQLANWCQDAFSLLADNPLALKDPKSFLQEMLQSQGLYRAEYVDNHSGPAHRQTFSSQLYLILDDRGLMKVRLATGTSGSLRDAQKAAAATAIEQLIPRNTAGSLPPIATRFWRSYLDRITNESGVIVGACGIEHFKNLNSFTAFFGLKAFSSCLPDLLSYLEKPSFAKVVLRSIGRLAVLSPRNVLSLGKRGIDLITRPNPDDLQAFSDPEIDEWLTEIKKAATVLKLPSSEMPLHLKAIPVSDLAFVRDWEISIPPLDAATSISDLMFSHVVTILESIGQDWDQRRNRIDVVVEAAEDWRLIKLLFQKSEWNRLQLEQTVDQIWQHAFFSGVSDAIKDRDSQLSIDIKGLLFQTSEPHVHAYVDIMGRLYRNQSSFRSLYRIIHDLKNQIIAVRNYASMAVAEGKRFQTLAAIEQLQRKIRDREAALTLFFRVADEVSLKRTNLKHTIRDFIVKQMPTLPDSIRLAFTDNLDRADVIANEEFLVSLLENLSLNAIDAMPNGGRLSISASYKSSDAMLELVVADTGIGIPGDALPELFTSLKTTKATGMGLGLATVKQIVDQHDGLIDVTSTVGKGTKFTVLLPLQRAE